jgi:hypothetical protein
MLCLATSFRTKKQTTKATRRPAQLQTRLSHPDVARSQSENSNAVVHAKLPAAQQRSQRTFATADRRVLAKRTRSHERRCMLSKDELISFLFWICRSKRRRWWSYLIATRTMRDVADVYIWDLTCFLLAAPHRLLIVTTVGRTSVHMYR